MIFHWAEHHVFVPWVVQATIVAALLLLAGGFLVRRAAAGADGGVVPDEGVSVRNVLEVLVELLAGLARDRMGTDWRRYFPIVGTMFFFILISNLMGLVPGLDGATSDVNTTAAWAIISWVFYTWVGIRTHGRRYIVKFMGPSFFEREIFGRTVHFRMMIPLFLPLEIVLDLARMLTLAVRLLANMYADHTVVALWIMLVPVAVPAVFMGLGVVIAFLQAFIFALLTMIYIGLALDEPH